MPRYRVTDHNLHIEVGESDAEAVVLASLDAIIPKFTSKVYFMKFPNRDYPLIRDRKSRLGDVILVDEDQCPPEFLKAFRILDRGDEIILVLMPMQRLSEKDYRAMGNEILDRVRNA